MDSGQTTTSPLRGQHVVAVAGLVIRPAFADESPEMRVLALRRANDNRAGPGLWETISGRVERGEQPLHAIAREIVEESSLEVTLEARPFATYAAQRLGEPMIVILYRARYRSGEVVLSHEHDDFAWLTASEFRARSTLLPLVTVVEQALTETLCESAPTAAQERF